MATKILYKKLSEDRVKCLACSHYCTITNGNTGICGVRYNNNGKLELLTYGRGHVSIDPVEKKPLYHFLPTTEVFSIGTIGCNFGCLFCQNWDTAQLPQLTKIKLAKENSLDKLPEFVKGVGEKWSPKDIVNYCLENNIPNIAFTYNEPSIFLEYTYDVSVLAKKNGLNTIYVSNGYASHEAINMIHKYLDAVNVDLKSFSDKFYRKICKARLEPVLENIKQYHKLGVWLEVTTLIIPGENDSESELYEIAKFIHSVSESIPWHISRFMPAYKMLDHEPTPYETLLKAYEIGKEIGLKYVYAGNIHGRDVHSTYCPNCGKMLIERDWGYTRILNLKDGKCSYCGEPIEGIW